MTEECLLIYGITNKLFWFWGINPAADLKKKAFSEVKTAYIRRLGNLEQFFWAEHGKITCIV